MLTGDLLLGDDCGVSWERRWGVGTAIVISSALLLCNRNIYWKKRNRRKQRRDRYIVVGEGDSIVHAEKPNICTCTLCVQQICIMIMWGYLINSVQA